MNRQEKIEQIRKGKFFAWGDAAVFAAAFLLIALFTLIPFFGAGGEPADFFSVYYRNEEIFTAPLREDAVYVFHVDEGRGFVCPYTENGDRHSEFNIIEVSGGKVCVRDADCADRICVLWGAVDSGEINCLPHHMKISVHRGKGGTDL